MVDIASATKIKAPWDDQRNNICIRWTFESADNPPGLCGCVPMQLYPCGQWNLLQQARTVGICVLQGTDISTAHWSLTCDLLKHQLPTMIQLVPAPGIAHHQYDVISRATCTLSQNSAGCCMIPRQTSINVGLSPMTTCKPADHGSWQGLFELTTKAGASTNASA